MAVSEALENNSQAGKIKELSTRLRSFYGEVRGEMKKVTHPSWKEVQGTTLVVLATVAVFGVYFYLVDSVLSSLVESLFRHFGSQ